MTRARTLLLIALGCMGLSASLEAAPAPRSISTSRQFIVYGADAQLRGAICDLAERTKKIALDLLQEPDAWKTPIIVNAQFPQANLPELPPAQLDFSQTGHGLKLQLHLTIGADVSGPAIERELLRAVFLEMMYRQQPNTPAGTPYVEPPEWLLIGALAVAPGRDPAPLSDALSTPLRTERISSVEEFLRQKPELLDTPSRALYRAYSGALVSMLRDSPEGRARLGRFVGHLPQSGNDPIAELRSHFPAMGENAEKTEANWKIALTRLAGTEKYRVLSCEETERQLAVALQVGLPRAKEAASVYGLEEFASFIKEPAAMEALQRINEELLLLSARANPIYRPVIGEYQAAVAQLMRRKHKRLERRLAELRGTREQLSRRMNAIGDYLNWYEATQSRTASGAFESYMRAAEVAQEGRSTRRDPISVYLDALESQF